MLGYVKIDKGELKVREYEVYTGYYCGICKSIGSRYGQLPRMSLSYDAAFLAILLGSISEDSDRPIQEHCIARPFIKKKTIIRSSAVDYAADVMLILAWYKLADDINDDGKLYAKVLTGLLSRTFDKLYEKHPALCDGMEKYLGELTALEEGKCPSIDRAAEAFSKIMELIFIEGYRSLYGENAENIDASAQATPLEALTKIGYHLGKWIYMIDAIDDIEENIESETYNPLLYRFQYDAASETPEDFRGRIEPDLRFNLYHYLAVLSEHVNSLDIKKNKGIIENIIFSGLNRKTDEIIRREDKDKQI